MTERATLKVTRNTWHGRLWHYWRDHSEFKNGQLHEYRENLCHYVRVILFWGPLSLFIYGRLSKKYPGITPASVFVSLAALAVLIWGLVVHPGDTLGTLLFVASFPIAFFLICKTGVWVENHEDEIKAWWRKPGVGARQLKALGRALAFPVFRIPFVIYPLAAGWIALIALVDIGWLLVPLGSVALAAAVIGAIYVIQEVVIPWARKRQPTKADRPERDESAIRVGARFVVAKKHRICPFIEVED